ncbi:thiosulfate:glutathione sulfurtransferase isoform X2 [Alosa sapidissima]|uniref:thiosulfate:glutathione sulfurtransferase isoform X2 n=1 Tax=Alosa sapidissima TaxID=34773 RepID=UPI001C0A0977|nr:thiosulfate:glutathione sulfurtransferase isoform X2 [Alosa sapidissima]
MLSYLFVRRLCLSAIGETACRSGSRAITIQCCNLRTSAAVNYNNNDASPDPDSVVSYEKIQSMLSSKNIQLFDVRNPDEFQAGRIPGSINIPLDSLEQSLKLSPQHFELLFEAKAPGKEDDNIVFHCQRGRRSASALEIAKRLGYMRARHYAGGYSEWAERDK